MLPTRMRGAAFAFLGLAIGMNPLATHAQDMEVIIALPAPTLTFTSHFVAEDGGFFEKEGVKVQTRNLVGVAATNAMLAGSVDFTHGSGPTFLRAASQGQRVLAIANVVDKLMVETVLRKDVAERLGITEKTPITERAHKLKGLTIAIQGVGSIIHAWTRLLADKGGLDIENDVRITPMDPPAMLPALASKAIDGYSTAMPFTTQAVLQGQAVMLASGVSDVPDVLPIAYNLIYTRAGVCEQKREMCRRVARAYAGAARMIQERPDEVFETILAKRFAKIDPDLLRAAWKLTKAAHARDIRVTNEQLDNSQKISIYAKLLEPKDVVKNYAGLFTDEFVK
ncbi:MAG: ABC transporter substrate-binding protein [Hyphomicrobiaceae bacterium]|nr:ABC transporter substrate-binding protein [Hyphomicrobiaceae bacterium]